jgi:hypothetical protein
MGPFKELVGEAVIALLQTFPAPKTNKHEVSD